jgi:hypothetical protein
MSAMQLTLERPEAASARTFGNKSSSVFLFFVALFLWSPNRKTYPSMTVHEVRFL